MSNSTAKFEGSGAFSEVARKKSADGVVSQLEELLLSGIYKSGERLPSEREMARILDISRPTLRQGLKDLEQRGLIVSRQGGGTYVGNLFGSIFSESMINLFRTNADAAADYLEYRREIEPVTARLAAQRATASDRALLTNIVVRMEEAHAAETGPDSADLASELDVEFHLAIGEMAHNAMLMHTLSSCYELLRRDAFYNRDFVSKIPGALDALFLQHKNIAERILRGDSEGAARAAETHIRYIERILRDAKKQNRREAVAAKRLEKVMTQRMPKQENK